MIYNRGPVRHWFQQTWKITKRRPWNWLSNPHPCRYSTSVSIKMFATSEYEPSRHFQMLKQITTHHAMPINYHNKLFRELILWPWTQHRMSYQIHGRQEVVKRDSRHWYTIRLGMMTSSNGNIFRVTGYLCGEFTGPRWFPAQRPVTRSFDVFFDLRLNKRLSKQSWGWWFETLSCPLLRHCNGMKWNSSK